MTNSWNRGLVLLGALAFLSATAWAEDSSPWGGPIKPPSPANQEEPAGTEGEGKLLTRGLTDPNAPPEATEPCDSTGNSATDCTQQPAEGSSQQ